MKTSLVSIVIPAFNRASQLPRALDSVLAQTVSDWEIVLVDDGSTDATREVVARYRDRIGDRLRYVFQDNRGPGAARNRGIERARGRFVAFLDSDDEFLPKKLERQLALVSRCPDLGFVYSDFSYRETGGAFVYSAFAVRHPTAREVPCEPVGPALFRCRGSLFDTLIRGYFICTITGLVRRDVLEEGVRFPEDLRFGEEWLFYLRVARRCDAGFVDEPLSVYHHHEGSLARFDRLQNVENFRRLLQAMHAEFGRDARRIGRITRGHLGLLERQLGCRAYRERRYREARRHFLSALRRQPDGRTVVHALQAFFREMATRGDQSNDRIADPTMAVEPAGGSCR